MRAAVAVERAGIPTVSLFCEGFRRQAEFSAVGMGCPNLPLAKIPGHVDVQSIEELRNNIFETSLDAVVHGLTREVPSQSAVPENATAREVIFTGPLEDVY